MTKIPFLGVLIFVIVQSCSAQWNPDLQLKNLLKGNCRLISPRVCKSISGFNPDYICGFILRHVCYGQDQMSPDQYLREKDLHVTPLPRSIHFYDIDRDGVISLKEFARTLGHDPSELHVKVAFFSADRDGNRVIDHREFEHNDVWVFERRQHVHTGHGRGSVGRQRLGNVQDSDESTEDDVSKERFSKDSEESSEDLSFEYHDTSSDELDPSETKKSQKSRGQIMDDKSEEDSFENEALFSSEEKEDASDIESAEDNNSIEKEDEEEKDNISDEHFGINSNEKESFEISSTEDMEDSNGNDASNDVASSEKSDEIGQLTFDLESNEKEDSHIDELDENSDEHIKPESHDTSVENEMDLSNGKNGRDDFNSKEDKSENRDVDESLEDDSVTTKSKNKEELKFNENFNLKGFTRKRDGAFRHSIEVMKNVVKALANETSTNTSEHQQINLPVLTRQDQKGMTSVPDGETDAEIENKGRSVQSNAVIGPNTFIWVPVPSKRSRPSF